MLSGKQARERALPKGPQGQKRPADVIGNAVKVMRIATGEESEGLDRAKSAAAELGARGGKARSANLSRERRSEILRGRQPRRVGGSKLLIGLHRSRD